MLGTPTWQVRPEHAVLAGPSPLRPKHSAPRPRPEQEVPAEASSPSSTEAGGRGSARSASSFRRNGVSTRGASARGVSSDPKYSRAFRLAAVRLAARLKSSKLHRLRRPAQEAKGRLPAFLSRCQAGTGSSGRTITSSSELRAPEAGTGGSGRPRAMPSEVKT